MLFAGLMEPKEFVSIAAMPPFHFWTRSPEEFGATYEDEAAMKAGTLDDQRKERIFCEMRRVFIALRDAQPYGGKWWLLETPSFMKAAH